MILVTTDGSDRSRDVLPHAAALANACGEGLCLLRVIEKPEEDSGALEEEMRASLAGVNTRCDVHVEWLLDGEKVHEAVLRYARETSARLIAMGSRGDSAVRHALGSVTMAVLGHASTPVMVSGPSSHPPGDEKASYTVAATTDFSPASKLVFDALQFLAGRTNVRIALTNVYIPTIGDMGPQKEVDERYRLLNELKHKYLPSTRSELLVEQARDLTTPASRLALDAAHNLQANAIAMSTKGHSAIRHVLLGSFASAVLSESDLPLILIRA